MSTPQKQRRGSRGNGRHVITDDHPETAPGPARTAEQRPRPSFRPSVPPTAPFRPVPAGRAVIGDSMARPEFPADLLRPPRQPQAAPGTAVAFYCEPGWPGRQMDAWVRNGEWESMDDLTTQLDNAFGDAIAGFTTASRHVRDTIADAAWKYCGGTGHPELVRELLRRVEALSAGTAPAERRAA